MTFFLPPFLVRTFTPNRKFTMTYSRGAKCLLGSLFSGRLNTYGKMKPRSYICTPFNPHFIANVRDASAVYASTIFTRNFSIGGSSEQMNLIRQLRERTCAPIKDVKSSLVSCDWDIEAAHKDLRKRGVVLAMKKSSRIATEGLLAVAHSDNKASVIELNCETDFVARNEIFQHLASSLAKIALSAECSGQHSPSSNSFDPEFIEGMTVKLDHPKLNGETTVQNAITEVAAMVGENVKLRRGFTVSTLSPGVVSCYLHTSPCPGLGRIAGFVTIEAEDESVSVDALQRVGSSLAMHVVASRPTFLSKELVSSEAVEAEREILKSQAESSGKSSMAIEKMVEGRLRKYFEEAVLLEQKFVLNDSITVKSVLNDLSKEVGSSVKIGSFMRIEVGEGFERLESCGPEEVAA